MALYLSLTYEEIGSGKMERNRLPQVGELVILPSEEMKARPLNIGFDDPMGDELMSLASLILRAPPTQWDS